MNLDELIQTRRAYRQLRATPVSDETVRRLAESAALAPSCFNNQPWRYVFVRDQRQLEKLFAAMSKGNEWTRDAAMVIAVASQRDKDCLVKEREYYLFDTGMATAFLILKATELGLVAHPIAGYDEEQAKNALGIPAEMRLITLINCGTHSDTPSVNVNAKQIEGEKSRPPRLPLTDIMRLERY
jgi:nitroreductase